ncbi:nuclear transport factor 2 family protein [Sphingomonas sp. RB56-2]|uniref:Nuclear transport factor 2 family protein n=1 Tax=Sphingomonas brevis TaxID=2908206 RepID=A0ABT0S9Z4_9SPHN|nr:nuclear transport factor 2 family protein [Sphingomonas brevis]MCL6741197.1 nuclear transport factor 2 family protein [Sphingomonas brevis]
MNKLIWTAAALAMAACSPQGDGTAQVKQAAAAERPSDKESEAYMWKAEEDWAAQSVRPIPGLMERILADDYSGVSSRGDTRTKADQIKSQAEPLDGTFVSSKLDYVHYRHFGDTVIAQGQESLKRADGKPDVQLIWHDIWMFRDGKWQVVASQDSKLPPKS